MDLDLCDENAYCTDLLDGYTCTCNDGFTGDGTFCLGQYTLMELFVLYIEIYTKTIQTVGKDVYIYSFLDCSIESERLNIANYI